MRVPLLLALAVIVLTPANIRDVAMEWADKAQTTVSSLMKSRTEPKTVEVAEAAVAARHETTKNSVSNIR